MTGQDLEDSRELQAGQKCEEVPVMDFTGTIQEEDFPNRMKGNYMPN